MRIASGIPAVVAAACKDGAMPDALHGIRVLDFTQAWAGPTCARLLGDFGADVLKVESETRPDLARMVGPYPNHEFDLDASGYFVEWNRNKRSLRLNLREPENVELARRVASTCDAVVENFAPGVMARLGLGYEELRVGNPQLVMLSLSGFGATGPLCRAPAFGQQIEAISGLMSVTGYEDGQPLKPGVSYPDPLSGIAGAAAVVAALRERRKSGRGAWLDMSMLEITTAQLSEPLVGAQLTGHAPGPRANSSPRWAPHGVYRCAGDDRWIAIDCQDGEDWEALRRTLGRPQTLEDDRFVDASNRLRHRDELDRALGELTGELRAEILARDLQERGVAAARAATIAELFHDEHLRDRGFWIPVEHANIGAVDTAGPMAVLSKTPARVRVQPALLGEHSEAIVAELDAVEEARASQGDVGKTANGRDVSQQPFRPLEGVRVVELAGEVAGPYAGKLLVGLGADVVKIEFSDGDPLRGGSAQDDGEPDASRAAFLSLNAGKRSVLVDPHDESGRQLLVELIASADLIVEDLASGKLEELAGDPWDERPELVVASISPFGRTGPRASWRGSDLVCWASGGMAHVTGEPDRAPLQAGSDQCAHLAGLQAVTGALIALHHRDVTGVGQRVDVSMEEAAASILESAVTEYQLHDHVRGRMGTRHPVAHGVGMQRLADGRWLFVGTCPQLRMWEACREIMGDPEWARDERWESYLERRVHADEIDALAAESFSKLTVEETLEPMLEKGIPVGLVYDALEVLELDQLEARGFFSTIVDPEVGSVRIPGTPWTAFVDGISFERAPNLGEHNAEIETELERARLARQL